MERLDLSSCGITDTTLAELVAHLYKDGRPLSLQELCLSFNSIGNAGLQHVAAMLSRKHCTLSSLGVQFNDFDSLECIE